ncbi:MAG TPA: hypothetical protein DEG55_03810 [Acidaminococcaceae bacterium]|nr:hypothetical protein [Acidaminococcaceae bacterium]
MDIVTGTKMRFRKEQWKNFIRDREASGLSVAAWCKQNGFAQSTYFKWLHRIRLEACQSLPEIQAVAPVPFVKVESNEVLQVSAPQPLPVVQPAATIQINLLNAEITIPDGTSPRTIRAALLALKELC